jgi:hypothetical protein
MIHNCYTKEIAIIKIGKLETTYADMAILKANEYQKAFFFNLLRDIELPLEDVYKLPNGGYDISKALRNLLKSKKYKNLPRPIIFITDDPLGEKEHENDPEWFFFSSQESSWDNEITIISTQPLSVLPKNRTYEDYLLMMLSTYIYSNFIGLNFHLEVRDCFLDYCDYLIDAERALQKGCLCLQCEQEIQKRLYSNKITIEQVAAAKRLMYKATNKKTCFVAMPINEDFNDVYQTIKNALGEKGWTVYRADEISFPRLITKRILLEIMSVDLVLADLTNNNPNVFFELGMAYMISHDILMISQDDSNSIPFDIKNEQVIFYKKDNLDLLKSSLMKSC